MKIVTFLLAFVPFFALAKENPALDPKQLEHPSKAVLWKIEGKDLKKPSFLFGTIHLSDPRVVNLHPNAEAALTQSDIVYTEVDFDPAKKMALTPKLVRTDGKKLSEALGPETLKDVTQVLKAINPALSLDPFEPLKTWTVAVTLPLLEFQFAGQQALDEVIASRAKELGKEVDFLESAESQLAIFDRLTEDEQLAIFKETVKVMKESQEAGTNKIEELLNIYLTQGIDEISTHVKDELAKTTSNPELTDKLTKELLDDRNLSMTETIKKKFAANPDQTHFFAIGAGHYTGPTAIQSLLKKEGYQITPLFD